jgi:uncharacterized membrane protein
MSTLSDPASRSGELALDGDRFVVGVLAVQALVVLIVAVEWFGPSVSVLRDVVVTGYLTFVPGTLLLAALGIDRRNLSTMAGYAIGLSFVLVMAVGVVMSLTYPLFGVERPISIGPLVATFGVLVVGLSVVVYRRERTFRVSVPGREAVDFVPLLLLSLPFVAFLGSATYAVAGNNYVLLAVLTGIALAPLAVAAVRGRSRWLGLGVWAVSLALLYHGQFGAGGGHQDAVFTIRAGRWVIDSGGPVLPNAVLYPVYALMNDVSLGLQYDGVNPFFVSFIPLVLYESFRRYLDDDWSFFGACLFMFSFPFYTLYPSGGRIATPVLFLALLGLVLSDTELTSVQKVFLSVVFGAGVGVSHYGTAYLVVFGLLASAVFVRLLMLHDRLRFGEYAGFFGGLRTDGGVFGGRVLSLLRAPYVLFLSAFVVAWYLLTDSARKFEPLPRKIEAQVNGVLYGEFTGDAAEVATKGYGGAESVIISRNMYFVIGVLMVLGVLITVLFRLRRQDQVFDDEYLALGVGFLGVLGASFLPGGSGFNTARVMMIAFAFTVPFVIVGTERPLTLLARLSGLVDVSRARRFGAVLLAAFLCVFLLFNAGVASELFLHDFAPSQQVSSQRLAESDDVQNRLRVTACTPCNVDTHVWARSHAPPGADIYGDNRAVGEIDFYRGALTERLGEYPSKGRYTSMAGLKDGAEDGSLVLLLGHNTDTGVFLNDTRYRAEPLSSLEPSMSGSSRVYQGGGTEVRLVRNDSVPA